MLAPSLAIVLLPFLGMLSSACPATPAAPLPLGAVNVDFDHEHARWTRILRASVRDGGFDYAGLKKDRTEFDAYTTELRAVTPEQLAGWNEKQRFAFWLNVYNAFCIRQVVDNYPLESIRDLDGAFGLNSVFKKEFIPMRPHHPDGKNDDLSLNDIEHEILRKRFKDARLHAAVNCASLSCPPLRNEAFVAARLYEQLEEQMRAFVADTTRNRIDPQGGKLRVSEIFKWFEEDFERDAESVKEFLIRFAPAEKAAFIRSTKLRYLDYDWALNDVSSD
jgi:hypothetical protein